MRQPWVLIDGLGGTDASARAKAEGRTYASTLRVIERGVCKTFQVYVWAAFPQEPIHAAFADVAFAAGGKLKGLRVKLSPGRKNKPQKSR